MYRHSVGEDPLPSEHFIVNPDQPRLGFFGFVRPNVGAIPPMSEIQVQWWIQYMKGNIRRVYEEGQDFIALSKKVVNVVPRLRNPKYAKYRQMYADARKYVLDHILCLPDTSAAAPLDQDHERMLALEDTKESSSGTSTSKINVNKYSSQKKLVRPEPTYMLLGKKYQYGVDYGNYMHRVAEDFGGEPSLFKMVVCKKPCQLISALKIMYTYCLGQAHIPLFRLHGPYASKMCWDIVEGELYQACIDRGVWENAGLLIMTVWFFWINMFFLALEVVLAMLGIREFRGFQRYG